MSEEQFLAEVAAIIDEAVMRAQGVSDWKGEYSSEEAAKDVAALVPGYVWT